MIVHTKEELIKYLKGVVRRLESKEFSIENNCNLAYIRNCVLTLEDLEKERKQK